MLTGNSHMRLGIIALTSYLLLMFGQLGCGHDPQPTMAIMAQEISSGDTSGKGQLSLTFVVSEAVTDFQHHDIISTNGEIVAFDGSGTMYYGTFIPATEGPCSIGVDEDSFHGANGAGNVPTTFNWTHRLGGKHMCFMGETYTQIYNGTPELVVSE